ncbi:hypothetical protein [Christiangramia sabulilitoris]|uniref:PKD domain-containing protein n=1 Tax=Christiangramia sabulilitoris TaxID=2583991 RepID=A0A550I957_9FLAO|nr:hypothetical protein [Christiangramia sabulilitoris]TRO67521.1 hypothetical protein FGM01_06465 [Christiangramia sabulilitoris]
MKIFKFLAMLTISVLFFTGCEDEEITNYAFQEISAPTNVSAIFDVSQDDTGTVTITPSGEGAQVFQVDLGNGETAELAAGESVTTAYAEGEYMVKIVAVGSTGLTSEYNQMLNISFKAPENLEIIIDQPASNPKLITVSATADNATVFDVYFGDVDDEEPTQLMPGESVQHTYAPGVYEITVVARGAGAATAEEDAIVIIPEATDPLKLPITYDMGTVNYAADVFGGTSYEIVVNPDLSGANTTESNVAAVTNSGANWEGIVYTLGEPVDFSGDDKIITMKVWSDVAQPVLLKFEGGVNDERQTEVVANHGGTGWEELSFNFATDAVKSFIDGNQGVGEPFVPTGQYAAMVIFFDGPGTTAGTFYIDDIMQESTAPDCVAETTENIDAANGPINWTFKTDDDEDFDFNPFGNIESEIVRNPKTDGINNSCNVQRVIKTPGCETWSGVGTEIPTAIDFTTTDKKIFKLKVLAETQTAEVTLRLEREPFPDVDPAEDRVAQITETGVWQELTFDFSDVDDKTFRSIIIYFERDASCDGDVYYFDDLIQTDGTGGGTPPASTTTSFPVDFETASNGGASANWTVFENVDNPALEIIANPDMTGNASATVAKFTARQDGQPFAGTITQLTNPFTLDASNAIVKMWVWKSKISDVGIKFENATQGSTGEIKVANTKVNEWEELTFDFSGVIGDPNNTNITGLVIFPDFEDRAAESVSYFDNITLNSTTGGGSGGGDPVVATSLPIDFESNETLQGVFESSQGVTGMPVSNPDMTGNNSSTVYEFNKANNAAWYSGIFHIFPNNIDLSQGTTFSIKVWSPKANVNVRFQLELEGSDASPNISVDQTVTQANTWVTLTYDFAGIIDTNNNYDKFVIFPDYDDVAQAPADGSVYYIDDIEQN